MTSEIMLLAVDVGNTHTVTGIYDGEALRASWRVPTDRNATPDELRVGLLSLMAMDGISRSEVSSAVLSSVVPQLAGGWEEAVRRLFGVEMLHCTAKSAGDLFQADYPHPEEIGADRVADAVAAKALYGCPCVVVDFGTATNMEVIDARGCFIGGIIAPGLQTSASTLFAQGAKLAAVELVPPPQAIGRNTREALESGILLGEVERTDGLIRRIFDELGYEAHTVATGGLARQIAGLSKMIDAVDLELTLTGLRLISEAHQRR